MAEAATNEEVKDTGEAQAKGAPEGVRNKDLSEGQSHDGSPAPKVNNQPPVKEATAEEKAAADKKAADDKAASDKAASDKAATDKVAADKVAADKAAEEAAAGEPTEYHKYNNEAADSVVALLKEANVPPAEAKKYFGKAVETGKLEDVDKAALIAKVGKDKAALIMIGVEKYYNDVGAAVVAVKQAAHTEVGGEEAFATIAKWAQEKEKTDTKFATTLNEYRAMFESNPTAARLAAKELKAAYNADPNNKSLQLNVVTGDKPGADLTTKGISRGEYIEKLKEAEKKGDKAEIARLNAARMAGKKAGM